MTAVLVQSEPQAADHRHPHLGVAPRRRRATWGDAALLATTALSVAAAAAVVTLGLDVAPVLTDSMSPAFGAGSVVVTTARPASDLEIGDVAVLPLPDASGEHDAHRIVAVDRADGQVVVRTQGDNNPGPDEWTLRVTSSEVPVVVADVPVVGHLQDIVRTTRSRLAVAAVAAASVLIAVGRALRRATAPR